MACCSAVSCTVRSTSICPNFFFFALNILILLHAIQQKEGGTKKLCSPKFAACLCLHWTMSQIATLVLLINNVPIQETGRVYVREVSPTLRQLFCREYFSFAPSSNLFAGCVPCCWVGFCHLTHTVKVSNSWVIASTSRRLRLRCLTTTCPSITVFT